MKKIVRVGGVDVMILMLEEGVLKVKWAEREWEEWKELQEDAVFFPGAYGTCQSVIREECGREREREERSI